MTRDHVAPLRARVDSIDWTCVQADLDAQGWAIAPGLLSEAEARSVSSLYHRDDCFRSHVVMARHGLGRGAYKYFRYPLPVRSPRSASLPGLISCRSPTNGINAAARGAVFIDT